MAYYRYICPKCQLDFTISKAIMYYDRDEPCPDCEALGVKQLSALPGHGLSDGPGTSTPNRPHKPIFDKPDPHNDIPYTYNQLESAGEFTKNPEFKKNMDYKMATLKSRPRENVDYQKVGHPVER